MSRRGERLPHRIQGLAEIRQRGLARLGLVEQDHEGIGEGFSDWAKLPRRVLVDPVQGRELHSRMMDYLSCDCAPGSKPGAVQVN